MSCLDPSRARLHVCITFLYRKERTRFLFDSVLSLLRFNVESVEIVICTDSDDSAILATLNRLFEKLVDDRFSVRIASFPEVHDRNPRELAWAHKPVQRAAFAQEAPRYTHFITLEDDILFTEANFRYFCHLREPLGAHGLLPGFVRLEFNNREADIFACDQHGTQTMLDRPLLAVCGLDFVPLTFPYMAMYVLDRTLMREYVDSFSFDMHASQQRTSWGLMERAVMGLTWERVPATFLSRQVVPLKGGTLMPHPMSWIYHGPSNYTNDYSPGPNYVCGKIRMDQIFEGAQPRLIEA